jgi:hypothetical protein
MSTTATRPAGTTTPPRGAIDPRGPQFTATLTVVVLAAVLLAPAPYGVAILAVQAVLFAIGAVRGVQATPHAWLFRTLVRPRLAPTTEWEAPEPPRFAQGVGLAFAVLGLVGYLAGATVLGQVAVGAALAAALLNAAFGFCLGCELYLLGQRTKRSLASAL